MRSQEDQATIDRMNSGLQRRLDDAIEAMRTCGVIPESEQSETPESILWVFALNMVVEQEYSAIRSWGHPLYRLLYPHVPDIRKARQYE